MTDSRSGDGGERPEIGELLSGLDPPRSLPESLRQRLEDELSAGAPVRPLEPELNERLTAALGIREDQDMAMLFSGLDAPRPLPADVSNRLRDQLGDQLAPRRRRDGTLARMGFRAQIGAGAAAVSLLVAAVTGIALASHNSSRPAATAHSNVNGSRDAVRLGPLTQNAGGSTGAAASGTSGSGDGVAPPQAFNTQAGAAGAVPAGSTGNSQSASAAPAPATTTVPTKLAAPSPVPEVTSVVPGSGSPTGGNSVTIRGVQFTGATAVHFGTMAALNFVVTSNGAIMAVSPPHLPGVVDVTVTTPHGTSSVTVSDRYDYTA